MDEELKAKLKAEGLDFAEETVKDLVENAFKTLRVIIKITPTDIDDMFLGLVDMVENMALKYADKIDGQQD